MPAAQIRAPGEQSISIRLPIGPKAQYSGHDKPVPHQSPSVNAELLLSHAIRVKSAEYWLMLGEADQALRELEALPQSRLTDRWREGKIQRGLAGTMVMVKDPLA
jgi:hypothetical protein